jgi:hypothetical protein
MEESHHKHNRKESATKAPEDYEIVFQLAESQASDPSILFPPGCRVCFDHSAVPTSKYVTDTIEGMVKSVSMGRDPSKHMTASMIFIYNVEVKDEKGDTSMMKFLQESLAYAYNCPVFLTVDDDKTIEAEVAFSQRVVIDTNRGHANLTYIVVSREGSRVRTEKGVKPSRVRYRRIEAIGEREQQKQISLQNDSNDVAVHVSNEGLNPPGDNTNNVAGLQIPKEIISNQMDSLSETLTDAPEVQILSVGASIPIKEEPMDEVPDAGITETIRLDAPTEKSSLITSSDARSDPPTYQHENICTNSTINPVPVLNSCQNVECYVNPEIDAMARRWIPPSGTLLNNNGIAGHVQEVDVTMEKSTHVTALDAKSDPPTNPRENNCSMNAYKPPSSLNKIIPPDSTPNLQRPSPANILQHGRQSNPVGTQNESPKPSGAADGLSDKNGASSHNNRKSEPPQNWDFDCKIVVP